MELCSSTTMTVFILMNVTANNSVWYCDDTCGNHCLPSICRRTHSKQWEIEEMYSTHVQTLSSYTISALYAHMFLVALSEKSSTEQEVILKIKRPADLSAFVQSPDILIFLFEYTYSLTLNPNWLSQYCF